MLAVCVGKAIWPGSVAAPGGEAFVTDAACRMYLQHGAADRQASHYGVDPSAPMELFDQRFAVILQQQLRQLLKGVASGHRRQYKDNVEAV